MAARRPADTQLNSTGGSLDNLQLGLPDPVEINEVSFHLDSRYGPYQIHGCTPQFAMVMLGFGACSAAEPSSQPAISATIGMQHQEHALCLVQAYRLADLLQNKLAVRFVFWRCQALRSPRNLDRVGVEHADALEELSESQFETVVETPDDSRVAMILLSRSVEVKDFLHCKPSFKWVQPQPQYHH